MFYSSSPPLLSHRLQKYQTFLADELKKLYKAQVKISGHSVYINQIYNPFKGASAITWTGNNERRLGLLLEQGPQAKLNYSK